ncbi:MAG: hypothetical protein ACXAEU_02385 [Candidatus Hodarchaeales archaeon]
MECGKSLKPIGKEMIFSLEQDTIEIGVQCYQQLESNFIFWRVEIRVEGEILHAQMFFNGNEARSFARDLQDLFYNGVTPFEKEKLAMV